MELYELTMDDVNVMTSDELSSVTKLIKKFVPRLGKTKRTFINTFYSNPMEISKVIREFVPKDYLLYVTGGSKHHGGGFITNGILVLVTKAKKQGYDATQWTLIALN